MGNPNKVTDDINCKALGGKMRKDNGVICKLLSLILLMWVVICWSILWTVMKAGYANRFLDDCLMQANLAALVVDPYYYGATGELIFENSDDIKHIFESTFQESLGSEDLRKSLGIKDIEIAEFRIYEVTNLETREIIYDYNGGRSIMRHDNGKKIKAPDGTDIENSAIYAKIEVYTEFWHGINVRGIKEHCVDMMSKEWEDE